MRLLLRIFLTLHRVVGGNVVVVAVSIDKVAAVPQTVQLSASSIESSLLSVKSLVSVECPAVLGLVKPAGANEPTVDILGCGWVSDKMAQCRDRIGVVRGGKTLHLHIGFAQHVFVVVSAGNDMISGVSCRAMAQEVKVGVRLGSDSRCTSKKLHA